MEVTQDQLQEKMLSGLIDICRAVDSHPDEAMGAALGAALQFTILVSEVAGRNTLRDLYYTRRKLTEVINEYKRRDHERV